MVPKAIHDSTGASNPMALTIWVGGVIHGAGAGRGPGSGDRPGTTVRRLAATMARPLPVDARSGSTSHESVAVLIPVKAFSAAKGRLTEALDGPARAALARQCASRVLAAAAPLPVFVVCDDDDVAAWSQSLGASVVWRSVPGLNAAVQAGVAHLAGAGFGRAIVAHADLPLATDLAVVLGAPGITAVPDRHGDGTNVCSVPTRAGFRFAYGPGSCRRHRVEAHRIGLPWRELLIDELGWDIDVPADLDLPAALTHTADMGRHRPDVES